MDQSTEAALTLLIGIIVVGVALTFYLVPSIVAFKRGHPHRLAILIVNFLFGATAIGWIGCLVWALITPRTVDFAIPVVITDRRVRREPTFP